MRILMLSVIGAVLLAPPPSLKKPGPSGRGYIILDKDCNVQATNLIVTVPDHPHNVRVEWKVISDGCEKARVAVGAYKRKADSKYYPLLACPPVGAVVKDGENETYTCRLNLECPQDNTGEDYEYTVCVDGEPVWDPELRVKGGGRLEASRECGAVPDKTQMVNECRDSSMP